MPQPEGQFKLSEFTLQCGTTLPETTLTYKTYGSLSENRDNAILFPTWFSSTHSQNEWLIGPDKALDPRRYFIVSVNLLGNGLSSSPSNTPPPYDGARFPSISVLDNARLQQRMLQEIWGIERLALVIGRSMGAQVTFQWASYFPDRVCRALALSGSSRTTPHNYVFLDGVKNALLLDPAWHNGEAREAPIGGLKLMGRLYAGWALSASFYRHRLFEQEGASTVDDYIAKRWEPNFTKRNAHDLLSQIDTWQRADISANERFQGDWEAALAACTARTIVMPCRSDMFFPPEDSAAAVDHMPNAELRVIPSDWGHRAGAAGSDPEDIAFVERAIDDLLTAE